jgi:SWI/SNF related-matrix-associated actin-dependent regulator of chromatin subfamily C
MSLYCIYTGIQIDPEARPATLAPPFTGHFRVVLDTPRGLQSLHPGTRPPNPSASILNGGTKPPAPVAPASLELRSSIYQTTSKSSRQISAAEAASLANGASESDASNGTTGKGIALVTYTCDTCGTDCTTVRYHSLKVKNFELCQPCYLDGRFPSTMFSGDFVKLSSVPSGAAHGGGDDDWSDQEILLLLEGVEMHDDDWSLIEEHVGTRSSQQCIRKFLELPIEDPYLAAEGPMGPLRFSRIPFEQADNPVMSVVAFLAGVVGPGVAAEAAKTALHELTDGDKGTGEGTGEEQPSVNEGGGDQAAEQPDDRMDEDTAKVEPDVQISQPDDMGTPAPTAEGISKKLAVPHSKVVRAADLALKASAKAAKTLSDAEDAQIRSTLATLIKLTLTKLELKMSQFEELEEILEDERKGLESARMALVGERLNLKRTLDGVRSELAKNGVHGIPNVIAQTTFGTTGQGPIPNEVDSSMMEGDLGPVSDGNLLQLT